MSFHTDPGATPERRAAVEFYNQGLLANQTDKNLAYRLINSSVDVDPTFVQGWYQVSNFNGDMGLLHASIAAARRALEVNPLNAPIWCNLGHRLYHTGQHKLARKATERSIELDPNLSFAYCNLSLIESVEGNLKKSLALAKRAFEMNNDPVIESALAFAYLYNGDYAEGLKHFEARFPYKLTQFMQYPYPQWHGEDISDKTLFLQAEQGLGDTLSFVRFLPAVAARTGKVLFAVQAELMRLLATMLIPWENVSVIPLPASATSFFPQADYWSTPHSVPVALGLTTEEIRAAPGLAVPPFELPAPWKSPGRKFHIGVAWGGSTANEIDRWRSMDVTQFLEFYRVPGVQLYSLQVDNRSNDLHAQGCAALIKDLSRYIRDVADSIAILKNLDLVITIESFVGHICGLIDFPCWIAYAKNGGDFRHGRNQKHPLWYKNSIIYKQGDDATWFPVIDRMIEDLREVVK